MERKSRPEKQQKAPVCPVLSELEKSKRRFRKSETERIKFLEKYFARGTEDRPKKNYEYEEKPIRNVHTEGGCTPKRSRNFEIFEMGGMKVRIKEKNNSEQ